ncbi:MAG: methylmalonyl Co-A mutase-associated GTPase MeaB [Myxococcota bacterium]
MTASPEEVARIAKGVREGCQRSGARAIRWLEDEDAAGHAVLEQVLDAAGRAHWVGVTGPPGAGKSTLVGALVAEWRRRDQRVGVIAVDPSSPFSGGALLGDRVRMQRHATDPGVFIRSMATRGRLGGVCRATFEAGLVLDAMGYDVVVIETVGVGQDELEVVELAHSTVVVNVPGLGDDVQALKAGIFEVGEVFVLNKADRSGADETEKQLRTLLHLRGADANGWEAPLVRTIAEREQGVVELVEALASHGSHQGSAGRRAIEQRRNERLFREVLAERAADWFLGRAAEDRAVSEAIDAVRRGERTPYAVVDALLAEARAD